MDKRLEDTLKQIGGIKLKVTHDPIQRLYNEPHACIISIAYSKNLTSEVLVVDGTKQYYSLTLKSSSECSMDQIVVHRGLLLNEKDIVYVFPDTALRQLQRHIPTLINYVRP